MRVVWNGKNTTLSDLAESLNLNTLEYKKFHYLYREKMLSIEDAVTAIRPSFIIGLYAP